MIAAALVTSTSAALGQEKSGSDETSSESGDAKRSRAAGSDAASEVEPPKNDDWDISNVEEVPSKTYLFVGARYRGNIIPKFMLNMFVDEGKTIYSNSIGLQLDIRKDGFSLIPAIQYTEYGTGDILFKEKNTSDIAGNYSLVNSSMKSIYAMADLMWSSQISKNVAFEYGAGFGIGVLWGDLITNWVRIDPNGNLTGDNGRRYASCDVVGQPGTGCNKADHQNSEVDKVGGYSEPSWASGGSKPNVFPWLGIPQLGLRIKPVKQFVARTNLGFSLTGFWFGVSLEYGLEQKPKQ